MFCINCFHENTSVANSRAHKKKPSVWRRRHCNACGTVFTTIELPSLANGRLVHTSRSQTDNFNIGRLIISISEAFSHAPDEGKRHALALAQTIEMTLASQVKHITPPDIEAVAHQVLQKFDPLAAVQYAAKHQLIVSVKKRGRPSFVSHER
jgi:transcriptional regulator NrdR family protein